MAMIATFVIACLLALLGHYLNRIASARHHQRLEALQAKAKRGLQQLTEPSPQHNEQ